MLVKDHTSVTSFVTWFTINIAFLITFSSPTRRGFIWVVTSTYNYRVWSSTNPYVYQEASLHQLKMVVWMLRFIGKSLAQCSLTRHLLLKHTDVTSSGYRSSMISLHFLNTVKLMSGSNRTMHVCIQFGKPCHFYSHFLLINGFPLICGPHEIPDLFPLDFHLWGHLLRGAQNCPATINELKAQINEEISKIHSRMLKMCFPYKILSSVYSGWWGSFSVILVIC